MKVLWHERAWKDYFYWQTQDRKTLNRLNALLMDAMRNPFDGIGKHEPLKHQKGYWSRRIDDTNRIVYKVDGDAIVVIACKGHYDD